MGLYAREGRSGSGGDDACGRGLDVSRGETRLGRAVRGDDRAEHPRIAARRQSDASPDAHVTDIGGRKYRVKR